MKLIPPTGDGGGGSGSQAELWFPVPNPSNNLGSYKVVSAGGTGSVRLNFVVPPDFGSLVSLDMILAPAAGAAGAGKNIDLTTEYGADGQSVTEHSESDITSTYDFTGLTNIWTSIDISSVFSVLAADDRCAILSDHKTIGGALNYLGIFMVYTRA